MPNRKKSAKEPKGITKRIPFALMQRLAYIEESLFWSGEAARANLEQRFAISNQRAAMDFAFYRNQVPTNIHYDGSAKRYVPTDGFSPRYYEPNVDSALRAWAPVEAVPSLERTCDPAVLRILVQAVRRTKRAKLFYRSLNSATATWREVSPHTFVFDSQRYHVRVYDHTTEKWCDLVLGRIEKVELTTTDAASSKEDIEWSSRVVLTAAPSKQLSAIARQALLSDYGATDGAITIKTRAALRYYVEVLLGVKEWKSQRWKIQAIPTRAKK